MQSLTFTGPLLSEPTKAWRLEGQGLTLKEGFAATITEYLICSFVTATMSIAGLVYFVVHFAPPSVVAGIATGIVCLFSGSAKVIDIAFLFIPLQLGVLEGAYALVFEAMGLSAAAGFSVAFLRRARTLAIAGVGLMTLAVLTRNRQRRGPTSTSMRW